MKTKLIKLINLILRVVGYELIIVSKADRLFGKDFKVYSPKDLGKKLQSYKEKV